ncbi:hypothetical protein HYH03_005332 [Edaphochlamys debaryana]|uniref:Uncharacterized protein n=1 Tax=Edaphochlamys debaryana TaxID=47281 RepID=A0A835Y7K3_9CHLO|nr:hypothetical protein HYH03_005332 [Edaphochlamys debaryana]|eukprot:KAG2496507.1 hypothetical protein HYH03_005332 [Edaphochlamys debaryana]
MATMMRASSVRAAAPRRSAVVVRASAEQPRRAVLGLLAGAVGALLVAPQDAQAIKIASQPFTGGLVTGGGSSPKNPSTASSEGYIMEGTRKGGISASKKKKLLAKVRDQAAKAAAKS